jgi:hypothetical protein
MKERSHQSPPIFPLRLPLRSSGQATARHFERVAGELTARAGGERAMMGDSLRAPAGASVKFALRVVRAEGARVVVLLDGEPAALLKDGRVGSDDAQHDFSWSSDGKRHWLRVDVRSAEGKLLLLGNPIYLN